MADLKGVLARGSARTENCIEYARILWPAKGRCGGGDAQLQAAQQTNVRLRSLHKAPAREAATGYQAREDARKRLLKELHGSSCTACRKPHSQPHRGPDELTAMNGWEIQLFAAFLRTEK